MQRLCDSGFVFGFRESLHKYLQSFVIQRSSEANFPIALLDFISISTKKIAKPGCIFFVEFGLTLALETLKVHQIKQYFNIDVNLV